jgi:hypothetical protein
VFFTRMAEFLTVAFLGLGKKKCSNTLIKCVVFCNYLIFLDGKYC